MSTPIQPSGTEPLLTVTWDTVIGSRMTDSGTYDCPPDYEPVSLGGEVISALADRLYHQVQADADRIRRSALERLAEEVEQMRTAAVTEEVTRIVRETLASEIQQTDNYGRPRGEPKVLIDLIREDVQAYLDERVPRQGYGDRERPGGFRSLLKHEVDEALTKELRETIRAARADVAAKVKDRAAEIVGSVVKADIR